MNPSRRTVQTTVLAVIAAVTIYILKGLLGTIFFAITVAYVLLPLRDRFQAGGLPRWWAAATATATALLAGIGVFLPIGVVLYLRRSAALALLRSIPDSMTIAFDEFTYVIVIEDVTAFVARQTTRVAISLAQSMPVVLAKVVVFVFVVFALLYRGEQLRRAIESVVPLDFHADLARIHERVRKTLYSLYVIQAATAVATFVVALVVFFSLGIRYPVTLAVLAGLFQFLPVIGPSLVIGGLVLADLLAGDLVGAAVIGVVGLVFVGFLPDAVLRPRLAAETARLPGALYFVGVTGGILSLGAIGIVAGPLAIAILLEVLAVLAADATAVT